MRTCVIGYLLIGYLLIGALGIEFRGIIFGKRAKSEIEVLAREEDLYA